MLPLRIRKPCFSREARLRSGSLFKNFVDPGTSVFKPSAEASGNHPLFVLLNLAPPERYEFLETLIELGDPTTQENSQRLR